MFWCGDVRFLMREVVLVVEKRMMMVVWCIKGVVDEERELVVCVSGVEWDLVLVMGSLYWILIDF